jgi:hypothetical protein
MILTKLHQAMTDTAANLREVGMLGAGERASAAQHAERIRREAGLYG